MSTDIELDKAMHVFLTKGYGGLTEAEKEVIQEFLNKIAGKMSGGKRPESGADLLGDTSVANDKEGVRLGDRIVKPEDVVTIVRSEDTKQIVMPINVSYDEGILWLQRQRDNEEQEVRMYREYECLPQDGAYALFQSLKQIYGFVQQEAQRSWFGETPPQLVSVEISKGVFVNVPWGLFTLPGISGKFQTGFNGQTKPVFSIHAQLKRKHEREFNALADHVGQYLKDHSIYKGQAIELDLSFMMGETFDMNRHLPKFMDINVTDSDLIISKATEMALNASVFQRVEKTKRSLELGITLKHGVLLYGPYGVGKSMAAAVMAKKCVENHWTFIYLKKAEQLAACMRLAPVYGPVLVFAEDIDQIASGPIRDDKVNELLNSISGIDTKDSPIILVLTSNHAEMINEALLRAKRIDTAIQMHYPDAPTAIRFIQKHVGKYLAPDQDLEAVSNIMAGMSPAFCEEVCMKAKMYAMIEFDGDIEGRVLASHIMSGAISVKDHIDLMNQDKNKQIVSPTDAFVAHLVKQLSSVALDEQFIEDVATRVAAKMD